MESTDLNILREALSLYEEKHDTNTEDLFNEFLEMKEKAECYERIKETINGDENLELKLVTVQNKIRYTENELSEDLGDGIF